MSLDSLRRRLREIEARRNPLGLRGAVRIITANDAARQRAELEAVGRLGPGILLIDRCIVDPTPRTVQ